MSLSYRAYLDSKYGSPYSRIYDYPYYRSYLDSPSYYDRYGYHSSYYPYRYRSSYYDPLPPVAREVVYETPVRKTVVYDSPVRATATARYYDDLHYDSL